MPDPVQGSEQQLNRLLRRADWRFLLANPLPTQSLCSAGGDLRRAIELISGKVLGPENAPLGECDLAVLVNPDRASLQAAWKALRPGGSLYSEWRYPHAGGLNSLRRRLEASGFYQAEPYWPWPPPDLGTPLFWLPLDFPQVIDYYLASRPPLAGIGAKLGSGILSALWRVVFATGMLFPICVTASKPQPVHDSGDRKGNLAGSYQNEAGLESILRANWTAWGFGSPPRRFSWLLVARGRRSTNKVVSFVFADREAGPQVLVKFPRYPASVPALAREAQVLQAISQRKSGPHSGIPQVLFQVKQDGRTVVGETVLTATPLYAHLSRETHRELAMKVTSWLADLAARPVTRPRSDWWERIVEPALANFEHSFGPALHPNLIHHIRSVLDTLVDLPIVPEQRDCSPWNVMLDPEGNLVVLDWESAELEGLPLLDLIYFLTYQAFFLDGAMKSGRYGESYRRFLDPDSFTGRIATECIHRYLELTGIEPAVVQPLHLLAWLIHSQSEYQHLAADTAGLPDPKVLRNSLFVTLIKAELQR